MSARCHVPRTCMELTPDDVGEAKIRPMEEFRTVPAYVLLGDPGLGKTTTFRAECSAHGDEAEYLTARHFLRVSPGDHPGWKDKILFIDGLDEVRAGQTDARTKLDDLIGRLDALGAPRFRLSCRAADWLGSNDLANLSTVAPGGEIMVLSLNPLTDKDISRILDLRLTTTAPGTFINDARRRGLDGLLSNPQTLDMLIRLVNRGEDWPESRKETFDRFCSLLAAEPNQEHRIGSPDVDVHDRLYASGRLCTVQLLAGAAGYVTRYSEPEDGFLKAERIGLREGHAIQAALSTRLFTLVAEDRVVPTHRHIAEFMGARHLADLIGEGLPARRVLSLMIGADGTVVTELRGLSAWLAVHSRDARRHLTDIDPVGVCLYGDISAFTLDEKLELLESLKKRTYSPDIFLPEDAARSLTTAGMVPAIEEMLRETEGDEEHEETVLFLLSILSHGQPVPEFSDRLFDMVLDDSRSDSVRQSALRAFLHNSEDGPGRVARLNDLLSRIRLGMIRDPQQGLLGAAMTELYPNELSPSEVWDYLPEGGREVSNFEYLRFWNHLTDDLTTQQIEALINSLSARISDIQPFLERRHLRGVPLRVLDQALQVCGVSVDMKTLYQWLGVAKRARWGVSDKDPYLNGIRTWLEQHPEIQKDLILEGLSQSSGVEEVWKHHVDVRDRLVGAERPTDYGLWSLEQAVNLADALPWIAEHLLAEAFRSSQSPEKEEGITIDILRGRTTGINVLEARLEQLLTPVPTPPETLEMEREVERLRAEMDRRDAEELDYIRDNDAALRQNRAEPRLLYHLAEAYFGRSVGGGDATGRMALERLLHGDQDLVQAALLGIRGTVDRSDIPGPAEILELRKSNKMHFLSLPYLASMAERCTSVPDDISHLELDRFKTALMFYFCGFMDDYKPDWYVELLSVRLDVVADTQLQFTLAELRCGRDHIDRLFQLTYDPDHYEVARRIVLPLLRAFPTRCRTKQIGILNDLLWAAIQHADREAFKKLIEAKCSRKSMNLAQRAQWMVAGLITSPETYGIRVREFAVHSDYRGRLLADFFNEGAYFAEQSLSYLDIAAASVIISITGSSFGPSFLDRQGLVSPAMRASMLVHQLIGRIAASPTIEAKETLDTLLADTNLSNWQYRLSAARDAQRVILRDMLYEHPTPENIIETLENGAPSNPADLAALLVDVLEELAIQIRRGVTDDWRQYWDEGSGEQAPRPSHEDYCRNALLSDLQKVLPESLGTQREAQYANRRRSDIQVSCGSRFNVPVEMKKNGHRKLWTAIHQQLIKLYTSNPKTGGYGIYLVFWFGPQYTQAPPQGPKPHDHRELKRRLEETLSEEEARRITVCVIDVSLPR